MAEILFITPAEMTATTILGGNVDIEKYTTNVAFVQVTVIEPLLGTELYDAMHTKFATANYDATAMIGDYKTLMIDFVQPITKHEAMAEYIEISNLLVEQGGTFKHTADNRQIVEKDELQFLAGKYHSMAQMYIQRFNKWICKNTIAEYKRYQDEVNAQNIQVTGGWYFGRWQEGLKRQPTADDYINNDILNE
jgi:hypothetical protein